MLTTNLERIYGAPRAWRSVGLWLLCALSLAVCNNDATSDTDGECPIAAEGCPCTEGGACDAGLLCTDGLCTSPGCEVGSMGCLCDAGLCGDGLVCEGGTCVCPSTGGPPECAGEFVCHFSQDFCTFADIDTCVCNGCTTNSKCNGFEDCVCHDCKDEPSCASANQCEDDGLCDPHLEGCACEDCKLHPWC